MELSWALINQALDYLVQFGPMRSFPDIKEWLDALPQSNEAERLAFHEILIEIEFQAHLLGEKQLEDEIDIKQATTQLSQMYPQLSEPVLNWLIGGGLHSASK